MNHMEVNIQYVRFLSINHYQIKLSLNQIIINRTFAANEKDSRLQKAFERG